MPSSLGKRLGYGHGALIGITVSLDDLLKSCRILNIKSGVRGGASFFVILGSRRSQTVRDEDDLLVDVAASAAGFAHMFQGGRPIGARLVQVVALIPTVGQCDVLVGGELAQRFRRKLRLSSGEADDTDS